MKRDLVNGVLQGYEPQLSQKCVGFRADHLRGPEKVATLDTHHHPCRLPLATLDQDLRAAAKKVGVTCLPEEV
jgi:hypothetical protein